MGKWAFDIWAELFVKNKKAPADQIFQGVHVRGEKNSTTVSKLFNFCKNGYSSAKNTKFLVRSIFNSSTNFGPLMTNDGVFEL